MVVRICLFNDAITVSDCIASNDVMGDDELGRNLKDALMAFYCKVPFWRY
jgi:hypothetical protein